MARLIDANELDRKIVEMTKEPAYQHTEEDWLNGLCMAMEAVNEAPTVDAVEVVYCQDCARCKKGFCTIRKDSWGATLKVGLHDFCSDGERRTDNG
jgi:hypothetical protein